MPQTTYGEFKITLRNFLVDPDTAAIAQVNKLKQIRRDPYFLNYISQPEVQEVFREYLILLIKNGGEECFRALMSTRFQSILAGNAERLRLVLESPDNQNVFYGHLCRRPLVHIPPTALTEDGLRRQQRHVGATNQVQRAAIAPAQLDMLRAILEHLQRRQPNNANRHIIRNQNVVADRPRSNDILGILLRDQQRDNDIIRNLLRRGQQGHEQRAQRQPIADAAQVSVAFQHRVDALEPMLDQISSLAVLLNDPIGQEPMRDPVVICTGHTFHRRQIENHFSTNNNPIHPITKEPLANKVLTPNLLAKEIIDSFLQELESHVRSGNDNNNIDEQAIITNISRLVQKEDGEYFTDPVILLGEREGKTYEKADLLEQLKLQYPEQSDKELEAYYAPNYFVKDVIEHVNEFQNQARLSPS